MNLILLSRQYCFLLDKRDCLHMFNFGNKILACVQLQFVKIGNAGGKTVKTLHESRKPKHVLETSVDEQEKQYTAVRLNRAKPCPFCLFCFFKFLLHPSVWFLNAQRAVHDNSIVGGCITWDYGASGRDLQLLRWWSRKFYFALSNTQQNSCRCAVRLTS